MVTLLKEYEQQTYTLNSADDIDDIVFRNGDMVLLMDQDVLIIYDEEGDTWYPVPTGGGGGGGGGWRLIDSGTYTNATNNVANLTIPVPASTGRVMCYVENSTPIASAAQTVRWARMFTAGYPSGMNIIRFLTGEAVKTDNTSTYSALDSDGSPVITPYETEIIIRRISGTYTIKAGTYNWYIWGLA